jgi:hypothetical protein
MPKILSEEEIEKFKIYCECKNPVSIVFSDETVAESQQRTIKLLLHNILAYKACYNKQRNKLIWLEEECDDISQPIDLGDVQALCKEALAITPENVLEVE